MSNLIAFSRAVYGLSSGAAVLGIAALFIGAQLSEDRSPTTFALSLGAALLFFGPLLFPERRLEFAVLPNTAYHIAFYVAFVLEVGGCAWLLLTAAEYRALSLAIPVVALIPSAWIARIVAQTMIVMADVQFLWPSRVGRLILYGFLVLVYLLMPMYVLVLIPNIVGKLTKVKARRFGGKAPQG
jgi:hypothetical protein